MCVRARWVAGYKNESTKSKQGGRIWHIYYDIHPMSYLADFRLCSILCLLHLGFFFFFFLGMVGDQYVQWGDEPCLLFNSYNIYLLKRENLNRQEHLSEPLCRYIVDDIIRNWISLDQLLACFMIVWTSFPLVYILFI